MKDDQFKPEIGAAEDPEADRVDHVDFIVGYIWSNVILASIKPIVDF